MEFKKVSQSLYQFAIVLVIVTLPFARGANNFAVALLIVTWFFGMGGFSNDNLLLVWKNKVGVLGILFVIISAVGLLYTQNVNEGRRTIESLAPLVIFPFVLTGTKSFSGKDIIKLSRLFVKVIFFASILLLIIAALRTYQSGLNYVDPENSIIHNNFFYQRLASAIGIHPVFLSFFVDFSILILIHDLLTQANTKSIIAQKLFLIFFFIGFVIILKSGISALSLSFCLILYVLLFPTFIKKKFNLLKIVMSLLAVVVLSTIYLKVDIRNKVFHYDKSWIPPDGNWNAINLRLALWDTTVKTIKENSPFGVGTGDGEDKLLVNYRKEGFVFATVEKFQPHNQFLFTMLTIGVPGIIVLLLFILRAMICAFRRHDLLILSFVVLFVGFCMTDIVLNRNKPLILFALFLNLYEYKRFHFES